MILPLPDPISFVADIIGIVGIPTLAASTVGLYREAKKARQTKIASEYCLEFCDFRRVVLGLVPFDRMHAIPRPGDHVLLPGESSEGRRTLAEYKVEKVLFLYSESIEVDQPSGISPSKIVAVVQKNNPTNGD
jgi:hypothetical protein